jgi:hypothetical protein
LVLTEKAYLGSVLDDFNFNLLIELGMSLNGDEPARGVHALDSAAWRGAEESGLWRALEDNVLVHLLDTLWGAVSLMS